MLNLPDSFCNSRLFNCGIIEDVKIFELNIWISATHEKNEILLSGSRETVNTVQKTINKNFRVILCLLSIMLL